MKCDNCIFKENSGRLLWCSRHEEYLYELTDKFKENCIFNATEDDIKQQNK